MKYHCPYCKAPVRSLKSPVCLRCGCELEILSEIILSAKDSLGLAMLALREGRDRDAHDFARESWGLRRSRASSAAGLIAATMMREPIEISRWIRRREDLD